MADYLFAEGTEVAPEKTEAEIKRLLVREGATQVYSGWDAARVVIGFTMRNRQVRMVMPLPSDRNDRRRQAEERRRWRCLLMALKSKLTIVQTGASTFEREFLADIVLPDRRTVGEWIGPQLEETYASGRMPPLLGPAGEPEPGR